MLTIALTGGIGSGKTAVTELFQALASRLDFQCPVEIIDADTIARNLLAGSLQDTSGNSALKKVAQLFGIELFDANGRLQRDKLRSLIFSDKHKKRQLEELLHPLVYKEIISQINDVQAKQEEPGGETGFQIIIVSIPLLFETGSYDTSHFDRILVVDVPVELQIERSSKRDGSSVELIKKIVHSQVDRQTRLKQADDIIDNSGSTSELNKKVSALFAKYCSLAIKNTV